MTSELTYEDFVPESYAAIFKNVVRIQMGLARLAREVATELVGGEISTRGSEYVRTDLGLFHLVMAHNSLNSKERAAAESDGATIIVMGDPEQMGYWLREHGISFGYKRFHRRLRKTVEFVYAA